MTDCFQELFYDKHPVDDYDDMYIQYDIDVKDMQMIRAIHLLKTVLSYNDIELRCQLFPKPIKEYIKLTENLLKKYKTLNNAKLIHVLNRYVVELMDEL